MEMQAQRHAPCPICHSTEYTWGAMTGDVGYWKDKDWDEVRAMDFFMQLKLTTASLRTRLCNHCGNVQLFDSEHPFTRDAQRTGKQPR